MTGVAESLRPLLVEAQALGVAPRLDAAIWHQGELCELSSHEGPTGIFDLASLTKPLATGLIALGLAAKGKLQLDAVLEGGFTPRQLLDHSAGFAAWAPLFLTAKSVQKMVESIQEQKPIRPPGHATEYSDLGFLRLGVELVRIARPRQRAWALGPFELLFFRVLQPLGLLAEEDLGFHYRRFAGSRTAEPTGTRRPRPPAPWQEKALAGVTFHPVGEQRGEVDDDNAYALGGVAGNAGLFGTARAVALLGARFLEECEGARRIAPPELARDFCGPSGPGGRGLGWDRAWVKPGEHSSLGSLLGRGPKGAVGHLGFTGCSLWVDLDRRLSVALLTNRVFLGRENQAIRDFRPRFHDAVARALGLG